VLRIGSDAHRLGDRSGSEGGPQVVIEIGQVGVVEHVAVGQRDLTIDLGELIVDDTVLAERS
jgi:hypothetical protein